MNKLRLELKIKARKRANLLALGRNILNPQEMEELTTRIKMGLFMESGEPKL
ncbi:MAG: hypothetical protein HC764_25830 [Pleurocapsa sp. CRU_1_2]|nr:hypothetical protein [Pleurocapsa sp. CRU_1_2]